jgi:propanol-preferring alcohol dehydrogenase
MSALAVTPSPHRELVPGERIAMPRLGYACGIRDYCVSGREPLWLGQLNTGSVPS